MDVTTHARLVRRIVDGYFIKRHKKGHADDKAEQKQGPFPFLLSFVSSRSVARSHILFQSFVIFVLLLIDPWLPFAVHLTNQYDLVIHKSGTTMDGANECIDPTSDHSHA